MIIEAGGRCQRCEECARDRGVREFPVKVDRRLKAALGGTDILVGPNRRMRLNCHARANGAGKSLLVEMQACNLHEKVVVGVQGGWEPWKIARRRSRG